MDSKFTKFNDTVENITEYFKNKNFSKGFELLEHSNLPKIMILECQGNAEFYKKNYGGAFDLYVQALKIDEDYRIARYYYLWASKFYAEDNLVQAFEYYQEAIEIDPNFVDSYIDLGALMVKIGEFRSAKKCYEDALKLDPNDKNIKKSLDSLRQYF